MNLLCIGVWPGMAWREEHSLGALLETYSIYYILWFLRPLFPYCGLSEPSLRPADHVSTAKSTGYLQQTRQIPGQGKDTPGEDGAAAPSANDLASADTTSSGGNFYMPEYPDMQYQKDEDQYLPHSPRCTEAERANQRGRDSAWPRGGWPSAITGCKWGASTPTECCLTKTRQHGKRFQAL